MNVCTNSWQICNWRCHHSLTKFVPSHHYCAIASNWPIRNKFGRNRSKRGWDMAIFRFSTMADCWNLKFLTVGTLKRVELHNRIKFRRNRSNRGWDMAIFRFSRWQPPPSWICKISNFWRSGRSRGSKCIIMPNCIKIGWTAAEIWRFFNFSRWRPPPSWILEISIFNGQDGQEGRTTSAYQISPKSRKPRLRYNNFSIFPRWRPSAILDL